jgi:hypothetical protein
MTSRKEEVCNVVSPENTLGMKGEAVEGVKGEGVVGMKGEGVAGVKGEAVAGTYFTSGVRRMEKRECTSWTMVSASQAMSAPVAFP